jgi:integrase
MAREGAKRLTAASVDKLKPAEDRREVPDAGCPGLYLVVQPTGRKSFAVRYRFDGKPRKDTVGRYPAVSLAEARDLANSIINKVEKGEDPHEERAEQQASRKAAKADTYANAVEDFIQKYSIAKKGNRRHAEQRRLLLNANDDWHERPVSSITRREIHDVLDGFIAAGKPYLANRTYEVFGTFWKWLYARDRVPANIMDKVERPFDAEKPRDRVWSDGELKAIWRAGDSLNQFEAALVRLMVLTGQRRNEVAGMRWDELDLENGTWTLPEARAKGKRDHTFPLAPIAVRILKSLDRVDGNPFVFPGKGTRDGRPCPLTVGSKLQGRIAEKSNVKDFTFHDARRTFRTGLDRLGIPPHVKDECLNHARRGVGDVHYSAYDYLAEQRQAFDAWADHVQSVTSPQGVVPLHG